MEKSFLTGAFSSWPIQYPGEVINMLIIECELDFFNDLPQSLQDYIEKERLDFLEEYDTGG